MRLVKGRGKNGMKLVNLIKGGREMRLVKGRGKNWMIGISICFMACLVMLSMPVHAKSLLDEVKERGVLRAGVRFDYPPVGYIAKDGKPAGFGADIARAFAEKLGVDIKFIQVTSKSRIPLIVNRTIDAEIGASTPTRRRDEMADWSIVYMWDQGVILIHKGESKDIKDYGPPKVVAGTQGSIFEKLFYAEVPNGKMKLFQEYPDCVTALLKNKVDAVVLNIYTATHFTNIYKGKLDVGEAFFKDPIAIGLVENDSDWRDWINFTLQELWESKRYHEIYEKHYGKAPTFYMWSPYTLQPK